MAHVAVRRIYRRRMPSTCLEIPKHLPKLTGIMLRIYHARIIDSSRTSGRTVLGLAVESAARAGLQLRLRLDVTGQSREQYSFLWSTWVEHCYESGRTRLLHDFAALICWSTHWHRYVEYPTHVLHTTPYASSRAESTGIVYVVMIRHIAHLGDASPRLAPFEPSCFLLTADQSRERFRLRSLPPSPSPSVPSTGASANSCSAAFT